MQELNWQDLRYVLALSRSVSAAMAARKLGVNETTVARRLAGIEAVLNTRLFERTAGEMIATDAGVKAIKAAEQIEQQANALTEDISGSDQSISGTVRLTAVPVILNHLIVPAIPEFLVGLPNLAIDLIAESRDLSLTRRDADIAIRLARPTKETRVIARRVGNLKYAVYRGKNLHTSMPWINYEAGMSHLPQYHWIADQIKKSGSQARVKVNDAESVLACLKKGLGQSLLPTVVGDNEKAITRVSEEAGLSREIWMLVHPDLRKLGRVRTVMDWLIEVFK